MAKILIVDDEKSIRITLKAFLVNEGYEVELAEDVDMAKGVLKDNDVDVVVSDIVMPRVSGVTLLKQMRRISPDVPVVMMTGEPTLETAVEAVRAGAFDYLTKPVGKSAVLQSVSNAVRYRNLAVEKSRLEAQNKEYQTTLANLVEQRTGELRDAMNKLKTAQAQLIQQERMSALGQMASGIAHDFNNVLMPIVGFSEILLEDPKALDNRKETLHMLEMIRSCGEDARHIVRRMREIYKEDESEYGLVNLAEVVESVISITMPKWKEEMNAKGVSIEIETDFEDVPLIKGNVSELREAFTNIIFNAVDAMPDGGEILFRMKLQNGKNIILEVVDKGIGMDAETSRHCLEPFFTKKGEQGTGLGLPMVHGIVQRHGGRLEIDSEFGVGTTIRLQFLVPLDVECVTDAPDESNEPLPPMRILVIDDEARARNILHKILHHDGHDVVVAEDGIEGVEMFRNGVFDLVITDRAMPSMSGDEVAEEISEENPNIPILMVTGFGDIMNQEGESPRGVSRILSKPVTGKELKHVISQVMKAREL